MSQDGRMEGRTDGRTEVPTDTPYFTGLPAEAGGSNKATLMQI